MPKGTYPRHQRARGKRLSLEERFWQKVERRLDDPDACWVWSAGVFANGLGYGQFQYEGRPVLAHRMSWYLANGEWPKRALAHRCDTPTCIRVDHLVEASALENNRDMIEKGRNSMNGFLSDEDCSEIRRLVASGPRGTARRMSREYGVSEAMISFIVHRKRRVSNFTPSL